MKKDIIKSRKKFKKQEKIFAIYDPDENFVYVIILVIEFCNINNPKTWHFATTHTYSFQFLWDRGTGTN